MSKPIVQLSVTNFHFVKPDSLKSGNPEISRGGVQKEKKSKILKLCQDIGLDEVFLGKIL